MPTKKPEPPKKLVGRGAAMRDPEVRERAAQAAREQYAIEGYLRYATDPPKPYRGLSLEAIDSKIALEPSLARKTILIAQRHRAEEELASWEAARASRETLEEGFVKHAGAFSSRHRITYSVWREMGVPVTVLNRAGLSLGLGRPTSDQPASNVTSHGKVRTQPYKKRRKPTPEFLGEVLAVYEANGGGEAGQQAVADKWEYDYHYALTLIKKAQDAHWTGGLTIREAAD